MTTPDAMRAALVQIREGWEVYQEPNAAEVARVLADLPTPPPPELRLLYEFSEGGYLNDVEIFVLLELEQVNHERRYFRDFPSAIFFAGDGGDGWFFIDTGDDMGHGAGAIFWCDRASMSWGRCIPCADSLPAFLLAVHAGETPWLEREDLIRQSTADMLAALDAHPDAWLPAPPATIDDIYTAAEQIGVMLPYPLKELARRSNGLIFARSGVAVAAVREFVGFDIPLSGMDAPPLILFARQEAVQFAVTTHTWRGLAGVEPVAEGFVVRLQPGQIVTQAAVLGWLPYVIEDWLLPVTAHEGEGTENGTQ